jgi:two-component sensor histidine kinase
MLAPYDVDSRQVFACQLIADELATNALLHARSYFSLAIAISPRSVRIAVRDESRSYPVLTVPSSDALAGRGLSIVSETATRWGSESLGRGKETWADYAVDVDVEP